jgi:hypothetical protein
MVMGDFSMSREIHLLSIEKIVSSSVGRRNVLQKTNFEAIILRMTIIGIFARKRLLENPWQLKLMMVFIKMFSSLYSALMLILFALIQRGVAFEFRGKVESPGGRKHLGCLHLQLI